MKIANRQTTEQADTREISAEIDGFRLWYRLPKSYPVSTAGDPFLAAALLPAMVRGEKLEVHPGLPVSEKLFRNLSVLQEIHNSWNPALKIVPISAVTSASPSLHAGAMVFFSGGVDSTYSFLKRQQEISHLVFIQGFDFYSNEGDATTFSIGDISDLAQLAYKLWLPCGEIAGFIKSTISSATQQALANYQGSGAAPTELEKTLSKDLDQLIRGPSVHTKRRFAGIHLRQETEHLLEQNPTGDSLAGLNRLLLEDAFPLEIARRNNAVYQTAIARNAAYAASLGKALVPVATNHFPFGYRYNLSRNLTQGSALASVALLLGFSHTYVPAAYAYHQLIPLGSHPLTDPLWSTEGVTIIHDGAEARRVDKVIRIVKDPSAAANLRVCLDDMNDNCGKCAKCLRTLIPLRLLGASPAAFRPAPLPSTLRNLDIPNDIEKIFFMENYDLATLIGTDDLINALRGALRRYERKKLLRNTDNVLFGGRFKRLYRKWEQAVPGLRRIDTTPPQD